MDCRDNVGNIIKVGDEVLVKVPKTYKTYRKAIIRDFKDIRDSGFCQALIEYDDGRLYSNVENYCQKNCNNLKFTSKPTKVWRYSSDIVKCKPEYFDI